ncbi:MAG TPA: hypothetical protein VNM45_05725 [Bacillus sp. (in: firmicutes)]|nr:hypothetical protein [Bacillus sp. (in: firmicutes)]
MNNTHVSYSLELAGPVMHLLKRLHRQQFVTLTFFREKGLLKKEP